MNMRTFRLSILTVCTLCGIIYAQTPSTGPTSNARVEQIKPTIYVSFVWNDRDRVRLRLNNNTNWAIAVRTGAFYFNRKRTTLLEQGESVFTLPSNVEIDSLHYYVEKEPMTCTNQDLI